MKAWHAEAKRLREEGRTYAEIGACLGMAKSSVEYAVKALPSTTYRGARGGMTAEDRERRRAAVLALRDLGWATRRIAVTLDLSDHTVRSDLAGMHGPKPDRVVGRDGRRRPARRRPREIARRGRDD